MAASLGHVLAQIQRWTSPRLGELSDAALLERFVHERDESAFAALVSRHGDMVLRSCRRILGDAHAAEDAFQATFLVLARKAQTLRQPAALPGFLHSVARRVALKARSKADARAGQAPLPDELPEPCSDPLARLTARELLRVLDEEVARLPMAQRSAVMLCCLEGRTQEEAARLLGWTPGSLRGHLERGRHRLQARLLRRGITLSAAMAVAAVSHGEAASALLLRGTVTAALGGGGGSAAALAQSVLQTMFVSKLAAVTAVVLTIALTASVAVTLAYRGPVAEAPEDKIKAVPVAQKIAEPSKPPERTDALGDPLPPRAVARLGSLRLYHGQHAHCVTLSPDGKWVVSSALDGNRLWDAATGRELPLRHEFRKAALFATRDKLIAVEKPNLNLQLWDAAANKKIGGLLPAAELGQLNSEIHFGFPYGYTGIALAPDGRTLVVSNFDDVGAGVQRVLRFCDVDKGKVEQPVALESGQGSQTRMAFSADGKTLVVQCDDATIHVWDVARRTEKMKSRPSNDYGGQIALSPDGKILATAPVAGKRVRLWDLSNLKELPPLLKQPEEFLGAISFSADGKQLAVSYTTGPTVRLWDLDSRKEVQQFQGKAYQIFHTVFSADGKYLVAGDGEGITFWDAATGKYRHDFGHTYCIDSVAFSPNGKRLVSGAAYTDNIAHIWDPLTGKETAQLRGHKDGMEVVAYSPDGTLIATASQDGSVRLWDTATNREARRLDAKDGMVYAMAFAPDGKTLASGGWRKAFHLWDVATGRELRSVKNPGNRLIVRLAFSPDGKLLATRCVGEKEIRLWDVAKGAQIRGLQCPASYCPSLAFSLDGQTLFAGGNDAAVHFWDVSSGEPRVRIALSLQPGEVDAVHSVALSPDGRSVAVGYQYHSVRVWELASGRQRLRLEGHKGTIGSLAFSPDGTLLASGGVDRIIMVWDVTGQRTTPQPRKVRLRPEKANALWNELADADAAKAYRAMQTLFAAGGQAVSIFKERLHPAAALDKRRIDRSIADLDSDRFDLREKAAEELRQIGDDAEPALRRVLANKPSAEQRLRVKQLLQQIDAAHSPEYLRGLRAVEVLERLGSADAQQVLKSLAEGGAQARLTREAKAALERLQANPGR